MQTYDGTFLRREQWWVAWCDEIPGALTQARTLAEAKANLRDAIRVMQQPADPDELRGTKVVKATVRV